jgi:hypothetical protein
MDSRIAVGKRGDDIICIIHFTTGRDSITKELTVDVDGAARAMTGATVTSLDGDRCKDWSSVT